VLQYAAMSPQALSSWLIHLPIALLILGGALDLYGLARRQPLFQRIAVLLLVVGLFGGVLSALTGFGPADSPTAVLHKIWAILTLVIFGGLLALRLAARTGWTPSLKGMYLALALIGIIGLIITGVYGAELIANFGN